MLIVFGGTFFVVMSKFGLGDFLKGIKNVSFAFKFKIDDPEELIEVAVKLATAARKGGLLSLEEMEIDNPFMAKGVQFLVDGLEPEVVKNLLNKEVIQMSDRHGWGKKIFDAFGDVGPALGMVGTLIGLVQMLANMDDPKSIGPAMAVALLTTLYGAVLATMMSFPVSDKLFLRHEQEKRNQLLIIDALLAIQAGQNPRVIADLLNAYLPASKRKTDDDE